MPVILLDVTHYPPDNSHWHTIETPAPEWPTVEAAIRRLDRDEWPFLFLHLAPPMDDGPPQNALSVMGGRGEYFLSYWKDGDERHYYYDSTRSETEVEVWESDQGASFKETWLCSDIDRVLSIARFYADQGELPQDVSWTADF